MTRTRGAAAAPGRRRSAPARSAFLSDADRPALLLLAAWALYRLYPYVPALDPGKYWRAIRPVLQNPLPTGSDPFRLCLAWLLCCLLLEAVAGAARTPRLFAIFAGAIFLAKIVIVDNALNAADLAGASVAYVLWLLIFRRAPARHAILAVGFAALLIALRGALPHGILWPSVLEKAFLFGGLIWLLTRAGMRLTHATLATAALLLIVSAGLHGPWRLEVATNALVALGIGALFYGVGLTLSRRSTR